MTSEMELEVLSDGHRLVGGIVVPNEPRGLVLLLHGIPSVNPSEPGDLGYPGLAARFAGSGWAAAWVDMRAVRDSEGFFSIEGWVRDATAGLESARAVPGLEGLPAAIVGSSAGGAVAAEMTRRGAPVEAVALLAAPAHWVSYAGTPEEGVLRIREQAGMALAPEVLADPTSWAAEFEAVSTESAVTEIKVPLLVLHGSADDVVPASHAAMLGDAAPKAEVHILEGAGHQLRKVPEALDLVFAWLDRVMR